MVADEELNVESKEGSVCREYVNTDLEGEKITVMTTNVKVLEENGV